MVIGSRVVSTKVPFAVAGVLIFVAMTISGCGGGGGGGSSTAPPPSPPVVLQTNIALSVMGVGASSVLGKVSATDPQGLALMYSLTAAPSIGTATVDASTGAVTYSVPGDVSASSDRFTVTVTNGSSTSVGAVVVALNYDPLFKNQWHIRNTGATAFASVLPIAGNDMSVAPVWLSGVTGKGIKIGVVDTGLEAAHEDLAANVDVANSINFLTGRNDPTHDVADIGGDHGTMVASIIGAVAFNGKGGRGVAYNSRLRGYNLLAPGAGSIANFASAMGGVAASADNDIFNASFARIPNSTLPTFSGAFNAININLGTLRAGKGATLVNAAGNSFFDIAGAPGVCSLANAFQISCHDPATDERLGGTTPIIVGALNAEGKKSSYSSTGSSIWVVAPGGEYGVDQNFVSPTQCSRPGDCVKPAIVTASRTGCANSMGLVAGIPTNTLDSLGSNPFAASCQYTAMMNGTSSAAPNTSAVIALMLEANPSLTDRDIKDILAKTAKHVDPTFAGISNTAIIPGQTIVLEPGWMKNAAGFWFSNWYGFGSVDAAAAVAAAKAYSTHMAPELSYTVSTTPGTGLVVPAVSATGYGFGGVINPGFQTVDKIVLFINVETTPTIPVNINGTMISLGLQCVQIEMTSPSGTKSVLLHAATGISNASASNARILTNAFYGEPANGNWGLKFYNYCSTAAGQTILSSTVGQKFIIVGH